MRGTDDELVRAFVETGDTQAFEALVRRHLGEVRRLLVVMLPDSPEDREDVEQDILAALYLSLRRFRFRASFRTYLYRFCRNKAADFVRKRVRARRGEADLGVVEQAALVEDPGVAVARQETAQTVRDGLARLPEADRTILFLKESEELGLREIGRIMAIPIGTVKSRLSRARRRLAALLEEQGVTEEALG